MSDYKVGFDLIGMDRVLAEFQRFMKLVDTTGEEVFLHGGTLLTVYRDQRLKANDKDIDIGVKDEDALYRLQAALAPHFTNTHVTGGKGGKTLWVKQYVDDKFILVFEVQCFYKKGDIWYYNRWLGRSWKYREGHCSWPARQLDDLTTLKFAGMTLKIPANVEGFLTVFYGDDWHQPKDYKDWRYNCANLTAGYVGALPVVMIAGASRGLGKAITDDIKDTALLSVCSRTIDASESENYLAVKCDLTKRDEIEAWAKKTVAKYGCVDVLIFNAGLMKFAPLLEAKVSDLGDMRAVGVVGYLNALQIVVPIMMQRKSGYVINISSTRGLTGAPNKGLYSAVKHAAKALTDTVRAEFGNVVKATSVHFGVVFTKSSIDTYGVGISQFYPILEDDVTKTIKFLLSLEPAAKPKSIMIGGVL